MESDRKSRPQLSRLFNRATGNDRGDTGREVFLCLIFLAIAGYVGMLLAEPHYNRFALDGKAAELIQLSSYSNEQILEKFMDEVNRLEVSIAAEDIRIERLPNRDIRFSVAWSEDVYIFNYYLTTYDFSIRAIGGPP